MLQEELCNFILAYLPDLDAADNRQVLKAAQAMVADLAVKATTLAGYGILDAYTKSQTDALLSGKANNAISLGGYGILDAYTKDEIASLLSFKAAVANSLAGYGILDAYTKSQTDALLSGKANNAISLGGYGILDAYTKDEIASLLSFKAAVASSLAGYGILDAYTKAEVEQRLSTKQDKNTALLGVNGWKLDASTGLLEQWGVGAAGPDTVTAAIDFPRPFAEIYSCFGNKTSPNSEDGDGNAAGAFSISATQYKLFNDTDRYAATIQWRAIGKAPGY